MVIVHLPQILKQFGSLLLYMNEGCESSHSLTRLISSRKCNFQKSGTLPAFSELTLLPWRRIFHVTEYGCVWHGKLCEDTYSLTEKHQELLARFKDEANEILDTQNKDGNWDLGKIETKFNKEVAKFTSINLKEITKRKPQQAHFLTTTVKPKRKKLYGKKLMQQDKTVVQTTDKPTVKRCNRCTKDHVICDKKQPSCSYCCSKGAQCIYDTKKQVGRPRKITKVSVVDDINNFICDETIVPISVQHQPTQSIIPSFQSSTRVTPLNHITRTPTINMTALLQSISQQDQYVMEETNNNNIVEESEDGENSFDTSQPFAIDVLGQMNEIQLLSDNNSENEILDRLIDENCNILDAITDNFIDLLQDNSFEKIYSFDITNPFIDD